MPTYLAPVPPLADRLRDVVDSWARGQYDLVVLSAEFADTIEWIADGWPSAARWPAEGVRQSP